ncbi:hypothetical protein, partial [Desulfobacterium sp. N47]|uniref:hypothetical protein n=1 Tax=Desulfobacterium sp. N47 TaxID=3115210 RepID=UPI003F4A2F8A
MNKSKTKIFQKDAFYTCIPDSLMVVIYLSKHPPAKPEALRLLAPQRGLITIEKQKPSYQVSCNTCHFSSDFYRES